MLVSQTSYEQIIVAGIRNLPPERQREENCAEYEQLTEADLVALVTDELQNPKDT